MTATHEQKGRMSWLRDEIRRISNVTLAGTFAKDEDRLYWVDRLRKLNVELSALEAQTTPKRLTKV